MIHKVWSKKISQCHNDNRWVSIQSKATAWSEWRVWQSCSMGWSNRAFKMSGGHR
jgi:hypothetical protein